MLYWSRYHLLRVRVGTDKGFCVTHRPIHILIYKVICFPCTRPKVGNFSFHYEQILLGTI